MNDKLPPQDLEAERSVLGSIMVASEAIDDATMHVSPEHFYSEANGKMFAAMRDMVTSGRSPDVVTLGHELEARGQLEQVGGPAYLVKCLETVPHAAHCEYYARIVREMADRRFAITEATAIIKAAYDKTESVDAVLTTIEQHVGRLSESRVRNSRATDLQTILLEVVERIEAGQTHGMTTGYELLDQKTTGMHDGQLIVVGGRPGHGKSALACNIAHRISRDTPALIFNLEMSYLELAERILSLECCIGVSKMCGDLDDSQRQQLVMGSNMLYDRKLFIEDAADMTVSQIAAKVQLMHRKHGVRLVVVDHIGLIQTTDRKAPRHEQVAEFSRRMKCLAKSLRIPVIAVAQLNRNIENRQDKRPRLADLRETGAIEQDADQVWLLHRPSMDLDPTDPNYDSNDARLYIAKNRRGPVGKVDFNYDRELMMFTTESVPAEYATWN